MKTILDNGEQLEVTNEQYERLLAAKLIYVCECEDCNWCFSHLEPGVTFEQIEKFLKN